MFRFLLVITLIWGCASASVAQMPSKIETKIIDGNGLRALLPNKENRKPLLINFWATWCGPCHAEFPDLVKIDNDYRKKGLDFVLVSVDTPGLIESRVPEFLESYNATMPSYLLDLPNRSLQAKAIRKLFPGFRDVYPLTLLFDKNGRLVYQKLGRVNDNILRVQLKKILR
jgi:thiol-disulfide isomerase/thioredoxin